MGKIKVYACFLIAFIFTSFCFAKQVSFQIIQHDPSCDNVTEQTFTIEDELITAFFEQGFIVTNSPTVTSKSENQDEKYFATGLGDAFDGYSDLFVQMKVFYYPRTGTLTDTADIEKIQWTISNAKNGLLLTDKTVSNIQKINKKSDTKKVAAKVVAEIVSSVKNANKA